MLIAFMLIMAYVGLVYLRPQDILEGLKQVPILPTLLAAATLAWLFGQKKAETTPQHWLLPIFAVISPLAYLFRGWFTGTVGVFFLFLPNVLLFYVIAASTNTTNRHHNFMAWLGTLTCVLAIHGIDQAQSGIGWSGAELSQGTRITYIGIFGDPNDLALAFVVAIPMMFYCLVKSKGMLGRLYWLAAIGTVYYGIFLTNSRGGMLAAMAQFLMYVKGRYGVAAAGFAGAVGLGGISLLPTRLDNLGPDEASAAGRVDAWYEGFEMLAAHPFIGVGRLNFGEFHGGLTAHNSFVLVLGETGLPGYFLWISFLALSVMMVWRIAKRSPAAGTKGASNTEELRSLAVVYCQSLLGFCVAAFFLSRAYNVILYIVCALCIALHGIARASFPGWPVVRFWPIFWPLVGVCIGTIVFLYLVVRVLLALGK